jgi:hypothetical protein
MLKKEIPSNKKKDQIKHPFSDYELLVDLGFLGIEKDYDGNMKSIVIPEKRPRKSKKNPKPELTAEQKANNKAKSQIRIKVENSICGVKRFGILTQTFRNKSEVLNDTVIEVACGIWNLHLKLKGDFP